MNLPDNPSADLRRLNPHLFGHIAPAAIAPEPTPSKTPQTERLYLERLQSESWLSIHHQAIKLRIGEHRCWYTPDFMTVCLSGRIVMHAVKGRKVWDDARAKYQSAVRQYPCFGWVWAVWDGKRWSVKEG
jgi:hypothetical protein